MGGGMRRRRKEGRAGGERDKKVKWEGRSGQEEVGSVNRKRNEKKKKRRKL